MASSHPTIEMARTRISSHSAVGFGVFPHLEVLWKTVFSNACSHLRQQESTAAKKKDAHFWQEAAAFFPPGNTCASAKQGPRDVQS